jgi:hypothetical protein
MHLSSSHHFGSENTFLGKPLSVLGNVFPFLGKTPQLHTYFFFFLVLGLELRAFTLSHSTSPIHMKGFSR